MASTLQVNVVSAEEEIFSGEARMLFAPARLGEVGVLPRHAPMLTLLNPGEVRVKLADDSDEAFFISGGILEVQPDVVTVLADTAVRAEDLDEAAAIEARERAAKLMADREADLDFAHAQAELAEAIAQLQTIQRLRKRRGG